ncbi:MAG: head maturation protease, ClpP-related [Oenococcus sp.]|uniref:head maturation protease, ClpP-related n=1 Tax=Oenococcus sp. TaxID=1979414 RepID=UPI0039EB35B8
MVQKIQIKGDIVDDQTAQMYNFFNIPCANPGAVESQLLDAKGDDVVVDIASNGGDVFAGEQIYSALKDYAGKVTCRVMGLAASAASFVAMAGDNVQISPVGQLMIHKVWQDTQGNADSMTHAATVLNELDKSIVAAYTGKTGMSEDQVLKMMSDETWINAKDCVDCGLADEIMFTDTTQPAMMNSLSNIPSKEAVNTFLNLISKVKKPDVIPKENLVAPEDQKNKKTDESQPTLKQRKLAFLLGD